jgi:hypothetical protein
MIVAYFLILVLAGQPCPVLVGGKDGRGFENRSDCLDAREWLERRGYETGGCSVMSAPQEAIGLEVGYLPR